VTIFLASWTTNETAVFELRKMADTLDAVTVQYVELDEARRAREDEIDAGRGIGPNAA
jgi:hypothetical protein